MTLKFGLLAAAAGIATALVATTALAGKNDYVFEPVAVEVKNGAGSQLAVRLVHKPSGKPVEGAVIFRTRLDMSPDAMGEMTAKLAADPAKEPGITDPAPLDMFETIGPEGDREARARDRGRDQDCARHGQRLRRAHHRRVLYRDAGRWR